MHESKGRPDPHPPIFTALAAAVCAVLLASPHAVLAQGSTLEEIVVTAQKRAENLQDVPVSVSVIDAEHLERLAAKQLADFAGYMPGVNVATGGSPGQTSVTLRGIAPVGPGAVVGTYIDDTPLGSSANFARATVFALDLMPYDVQRVEVLRGPQGTLYGAGSMGGLLKYVLREPNPEEIELEAGVDVLDIRGAGDPGWGLRGAVNLPLGDTLAFRASAFNRETPGYIDNVDTGEDDVNEITQNGGRAALLWRPGADLSVKLGGLWQRVDSDSNGTMTLMLTGMDPPTGTPAFGDLNSTLALPEKFEKEVDYYSLTVDWDLGWASLTSASSYSDTHTVQQTDATEVFGALYPLLTGGAIPAGLNDFVLTMDLSKWTQEFRLASPTDGRVEWLLGAYYTDEESKNLQESFAFDAGGQPIPPFSPYFAFASLPSEYRELAIFGAVTVKLTDRFDITAGLRWADNEQEFRQISGGAILPDADDPGESSENVLTYMVSPRLHLSDDTMIYARVASGYRPGGPNVILPGFGIPPQVDADELTNYELGVKSRLWDSRALLNVSVFFIDWSDIQQAQSFGGVSGLANAGDAESKGFELESALYASDALRLGLNAAYTDATLTSNPPGLDNTLGAQLPNVPEWSGSFTLDYDFTLGVREAHVGAGWRYVGEQQSQVVTDSGNLSFRRPSYDVLDLNADLRFDRFTVRVFATNLTDERAYTGGGTVVNGLNIPIRIDANVLQPRTVGVSVDFHSR